MKLPRCFREHSGAVRKSRNASAREPLRLPKGLHPDLHSAGTRNGIPWRVYQLPRHSDAGHLIAALIDGQWRQCHLPGSSRDDSLVADAVALTIDRWRLETHVTACRRLRSNLFAAVA